jgi:squalene synthase HpnC
MAVDHYENFPVASGLLPPELRRPVALIYRFAREADDFADEGDAEPAERLRQLDGFRAELDRIEAREAPTVAWFGDLAEIIRAHQLPLQAFRDLLSAFAQDVTQHRYATHGDVLDYCSRSANPVGRLLLCLYRAATPVNLARSNAVCSSLQLINFLQDIDVDYRKGRIYLPADEMNRYGITEDQIARKDCSGRWLEFMRFQVARARGLLNAGAPLGRALPGRIGLELRTIVQGGDRILTKIAAVDYDVYRHRPVLRWHDWPGMLLRALAN